MTIRVCVLLACVTMAFPPPAAADVDSVRQIAWGGVQIQADADSAIVLIDGERVGVTPLTVDSLAEGPHSVTVLHTDIESWFAGSVRDTLFVKADTTLVFRYSLGNRYILSSEPDGAGVYAGDSLLGQTPLMLQETSPGLLSSLRLRKEGFADGHPAQSSERSFLLTTTLQPVWLPEQLHDHALLKLEKGSNTTPLYIAGAATVLSGTAAAFLKIKADNRYRRYLSTNDPAVLSQTRSLDTAAAAALVATQLSVALLAYFLLNE